MKYDLSNPDIKEIGDALSYVCFDELDGADDGFYEWVVYPFKAHYFKPFKHDSGASKGVLIFKDLGFVIKIPYIMYDGYELYGASYQGNDDWDYCSQEVNRYTMAEEEGLQEVFLKTEYLTSVNRHPIYIQPLATILKDLNGEEYSYHKSCSSQDDKNSADSINLANNFYDIHEVWDGEVYNKYGKDFYIKLKTFIKNISINDLRTANVGYWNGNPVLVDYAGYYE